MFCLKIWQNSDVQNPTFAINQPNDHKEEDSQKEAQFRSIWNDQRQVEMDDPVLQTLHAAFKHQRWWAMTLDFLYHQATILIPFLAFYIFGNIVKGTYSSFSNVVLVATVILIKLGKPFVRVCGESQLREIGVRMHGILTKMVMEKTLKVSLLSNRHVSSSSLMKLMQVDMERILTYPEVQSYVLNNIYSILFNMLIIVYLFAWAGLLGIAVLIATISLRVLFKKTIDDYEEELGRQTSSRVQRTMDIFAIIKFIKVAALEMTYFRKLVSLRQSELGVLHSKNKFQIIPVLMLTISVRFVMLTVFLMLIYQGKDFNTAAIFSLNFIFVNVNFHNLIWSLTSLNQVKISMKNIGAFLKTEQMNILHIKRGSIDDGDAIEVKNGDFYWEVAGEGEAAGRVQLRGVQLRVRRGEFVSVIGKFGSGKTSLFSALLGEMKEAGGSSIVLNGRVAYVSQKAWIVSDTVKGNILFGSPFDAARYQRALHFSCLKADLEILSEGDQTLIGERGCTLSGGQRTRVALARALYSEADVFLLDDVLSAVDAHVGAFLFFETFSKYLKGKTVLLATHSLNYVQHTDQILILDNCKIAAKGTFNELKDHPLLSEIETSVKTSDKQSYSACVLGLLSSQSESHVQRQVASDDEALSLFILHSGGLKFQVLTIILILMSSAASLLFWIWMNKWANSSDYHESHFAYIYTLLVLFNGLCIVLLFAYVMYSPILLQVYKGMVKAAVFASLSYFQSTPMAKIIHKLSKELGQLDKIFLHQFVFLASHLATLACFLISISYFSLLSHHYSVFLVFLLLLLSIIYEYSKYLKTVKSYRQRQEQLKIPMNSFYGEVVQGQATIRAFQKGQQKKNHFSSCLKKFKQVRATVENIQLLISFFLSFSSTIYMSFLMVYYFYFDLNNQYTVFLLFNVFCMEEYLLRSNENVMGFLIKIKCLARCEQLAKVPPEDGYKQLIKDWDEQEVYQKTAALRALSPFTRGQIEFRNVCVRYRREFGDVLKNVSFRIRGGEKVGVVGRTGSGKSTLFLALLRIVEPYTGSILIDGLDTASVSLCALRSSVNFILQEHFLFAGTVRANVDPSKEHSDEEVKHALGLCGLWEGLQRREGLETAVTEGGENLSAGERQLLNITRSLLARRNIVLVDEATASIDAQSDAAIQRVLSSHFRDCTVLTIAHRLNTVAGSDRILVLERGEVKEFDTPTNLLQKKESIYRKLFQQTSSTHPL